MNNNIKWNERKVQFADEISNRRCTLENQLTKEIKFKNYTSTYKDSLEYITSLITEGQISQSDIRKVIRKN